MNWWLRGGQHSRGRVWRWVWGNCLNFFSTSRPTPHPPQLQPQLRRSRSRSRWMWGQLKLRRSQLLRSQFMLVSGGKQSNTGVVTVTLPLKSPKQGWTPTFEVYTQRRLCCAPSVHFLRTILTH